MQMWMLMCTEMVVVMLMWKRLLLGERLLLVGHVYDCGDAFSTVSLCVDLVCIELN